MPLFKVGERAIIVARDEHCSECAKGLYGHTAQITRIIPERDVPPVKAAKWGNSWYEIVVDIGKILYACETVLRKFPPNDEPGKWEEVHKIWIPKDAEIPKPPVQRVLTSASL